MRLEFVVETIVVGLRRSLTKCECSIRSIQASDEACRLAPSDEEKGITKTMRKIHLLGLVMFAVFAFSAFAASSVFAAEGHEWLDNNIAIPLGTTIAVDSEGALLLEDTDTGTAVECHGVNTGDVGSDGTDLVATITVNSCEFDAGKLGECLSLAENGVLNVVAENLPWLTELVLETFEGVATLSDMVEADGAGNPAYLLECTVLVLGSPAKADDLCEVALATTLVTNEAGGIIDIEFMNNFGPFANCDVIVGGVLVLEGTGAGLASGLVTILAVDSTLSLSVN
jgi:hypothetical protein